VAQHLRHAAGIGFDIVVEVFGIRLTGAVGVGSALFSVDDDVHVSSLDL
jgi:predicted TIM-barrel enzyme